MFFEISQTPIEEMHECLRKDLLAYVTYGGRRCFSFPQYCFDKDVVSPLGVSVFPERGHLPMTNSSDLDASSMSEKFGEVVVMSVNSSDIKTNYGYENGTSPDVLNGVINPSFSKGSSQIEFTRFKEHSLSTRLVQVVTLVEPVNLEIPDARIVHMAPEEAQPMTRLILVAQPGSTKHYYGPFECNEAKSGGYRLSASNDYDTMIAAIAGDSLKNVIVLLNDVNESYAVFVDGQEVRELFDLAGNRYDWMRDDELRDAIGRLARLDSVGMTKNGARALKEAIASCSEAEAKIGLNESRRTRMESLLSNFLSWNELADEDKRSIISFAEPEELAKFIFDDRNFSTFFERVMEDSRISKQVEERRRRVTEETERLVAECDEARKKADEAKKELDEFASTLEEQRVILRRETEEQTAQAREERDKLKRESEQLRNELENLDDRRAIIEDQVRRTVRNMTDETTVRERILEDSMIKQIVSALNEPDHEEEPQVAKEPEHVLELLVLDASKKKSEKLMEIMLERLALTLGRELQHNEAANLLICLTQGYITTLSGLPGTGKTSLANALGAALGLRTPGASRFVQVAVERGWTSYKDLVGYFNPLTGMMVKSNPSLFDLMEAAYDEFLKKTSSAPWLILLDEANLSSVEYYWSPFLGMCDKFMQEPVPLPLGAEKPFLVPSSTRFIATVNFDHTTEELSPRFLDRSWIISLEPVELEVDAMNDSPLTQFDFSTVSTEDLTEAFGPRDISTMSEDNRSKLREVLDICARHHAPVSPRSQKMMARYITAAQRILDSSSAESSYAPVDYAVSQKVVPTLSGPEDTMRDLIDSLMGVGSLPMTRKHLERMSKAGENSGFIQFFA